jgi:hypothetical protein
MGLSSVATVRRSLALFPLHPTQNGRAVCGGLVMPMIVGFDKLLFRQPPDGAGHGRASCNGSMGEAGNIEEGTGLGRFCILCEFVVWVHCRFPDESYCVGRSTIHTDYWERQLFKRWNATLESGQRRAGNESR